MRTHPDGWTICVGAGLFIVSALLIAVSPDRPLYDEVWYRHYVQDLQAKGWTVAYVRELIGASGPLYGWVHWVFAPLTALDPVRMRLLTNVLFFSTGLVVAHVLAKTGAGNAACAVALLYAIPFSGVTYGVALTEVPAMLFSASAMAALVGYCLLREPSCESLRPRSLQQRVLWGCGLAAGAGSLFGMATSGRQNYVAVLAASPLLFTQGRKFDWLPWMAFASPFASMSAVLFWIWGGLVPEAARYTSQVAPDHNSVLLIGGLNLAYGLRSLAYAAVAFAVLSPGVFAQDRMVLGSSGVLAFGATVCFPDLRFLPSRYLMESLLGAKLLGPASLVLGTAFNAAGLWLLGSMVIHLRSVWRSVRISQTADDDPKPASAEPSLHSAQRPLGTAEEAVGASRPRLCSPGIDRPQLLSDKIYLFASLAWMLILASNMKISHQFCSRYVVVAAPFLAITAARHMTVSRNSLLRLVAGYVFSMALLLNYYRLN